MLFDLLAAFCHVRTCSVVGSDLLAKFLGFLEQRFHLVLAELPSDWVGLALDLEAPVLSSGFEVSGAIEGAIAYRIDAESRLQPGDGAVFVDRIATAPRNRPWVLEPPKYRGIGSILLLAAVRHSYLLGLGGRVWLTSLPSERTQKFYQDRGFEVIFEDEDGMIDLELPAVAAEKWLKKRGFL